MNPDGGYTRSYRRKWDNPVFANKAQAAVWAWMIDVAQYQNFTLRTKYGPVELQPGELVISERELSEDFNLHRNTLRSLLNRMIDAGMISLIRDRIPHRAGTIVRIAKYIDYQGFNGHSYDAKDRKADTTGTEEGPQKDQEQVRQYTEDNSEAYASGAGAPVSGGNVVAMPLSAQGELFGPVLADLAVAVPDEPPKEIRSVLGKALGHLGPDVALALAKQALLRAEPWNWLCKSIDERTKAAGGRPGKPREAGAQELLDKLAALGGLS